MSDAVMAEVKGLGESIARLGTSVDTKLAPLEGEIKSMKDAIAEMQLMVQKMPMGADGKRRDVSPEMKSMLDYISDRDKGFEAKAATVGNPTTGGYLAVPDFIAQVIPMLYNESPLLSEITVNQVSGNVAFVPVARGRPQATWVGEIEERTPSDAQLGAVNIPMNEVVCPTEISNVLIRDSNLVNAEQYLLSESTEAIRDAIGQAILKGDGHNKPEGILTNKKVKTIKSGVSRGITTDVLFDVMGALPDKAIPNAKWVMSNKTFWAIVKQFGKDSTYVTMPLAEGIRPAILGKPVVIAETPDLGTDGNKAIVFGDLKTAYRGIQSDQMSFIRDPYTKSKNGLTVMTYNMPFGGQVVRPEALVTVTVGA